MNEVCTTNGPHWNEARWRTFDMLRIATQSTLDLMPRRPHLALALILLLVLAPLAGAICGIDCLTITRHHHTHATATQSDCVRASACCHSSGPAICAATQASEAVAALPFTDSATPDAPALAFLTAESSSQNPRNFAAHRIDSSPPGKLRSTIPTPLRV
jgi:hypothetical protein